MLKSIKNFLIGADSAYSLPEVVEQEIKKQQNKSEQLISWVLLGIVIIFGVLYVSSRKTFNTEATFEPVPWTLSCYLVFAIIRLWASYRFTLSNWFSYLSALIDMTLVIKLIWIFHLQYEQIPAFYLKIPTLLYVFIFIALRTLRFEARFVFFTGMSAAVYWMLMLIYAIEKSPEGTLTKDYVEYLTSNRILIGGEVDKIITFVLVTIILTLSVARAKKLLITAVVKSESTKNLSSFFDSKIASQIANSQQSLQAGHGDLREVAIMHCDIRNFTQMTKEINPSQIMQILNKYQSIVIDAVEKMGGSVDKFMGDGVLISFNAINKDDKYAKNTFLAGFEILRNVNIWNEDRIKNNQDAVGVTICITSGVVLFGVVGSETRREITIIGDPVNMVTKLDKHAKLLNSKFLVAKNSFDCAKSQGYKASGNEISYDKASIFGCLQPVDLVSIPI